MKSSYKIASSVGTVALLLAGAAHAEPGRSALDQWTVNAGTITAAPCPGAAGGSFSSCGTALSEKGFFSRLIVDSATGKQFFQTIITMPDATAATKADLDKLAFADENFVSFSGSNGILDKQRIFQAQLVPKPGITDPHNVFFSNSSLVGTGWATDFVELTQAITDPSGANNGDGFETHFAYKQVGYLDTSTTTPRVPTGKAMKITSYIPISGTADKQDFVFVSKQGDLVKPNGSVQLPNPAGTGTLTLNWLGDTAPGVNTGVRGDHIQALWIGQNLNIAGGQFGFTAFSKLNPSNVITDRIAKFSLDSPAAVNWDAAVWGNLNTTGTINTLVAPFVTP